MMVFIPVVTPAGLSQPALLTGGFLRPPHLSSLLCPPLPPPLPLPPAPPPPAAGLPPVVVPPEPLVLAAPALEGPLPPEGVVWPPMLLPPEFDDEPAAAPPDPSPPPEEPMPGFGVSEPVSLHPPATTEIHKAAANVTVLGRIKSNCIMSSRDWLRAYGLGQRCADRVTPSGKGQGPAHLVAEIGDVDSERVQHRGVEAELTRCLAPCELWSER
jgi:hypothetical protein